MRLWLFPARPLILRSLSASQDRVFPDEPFPYRQFDDVPQAGVDIEAGDALVDRIKPLARATDRVGTMGGLGGFGALFDLKAAGFRDPVLVSTTDGVGTKLKIAIDAGCTDTVGIDLVAMCVNDLVVQGAEPLFFLDYFATGALDVAQAASVVAGIAEGCKPGRLRPGRRRDGRDARPVSAAATTIWPASASAPPSARTCSRPASPRATPSSACPAAACTATASPSSGASSRPAASPGTARPRSTPTVSLGAALLEPTRIYVQADAGAASRRLLLKAAAHITGGGLPGNLPRVLPPGTRAVLDASTWTVPPVFRWLAGVGGVADAEMLRVFNCGIGMALVVADAGRRHRAAGRTRRAVAVAIGRIEAFDGEPRADIGLSSTSRTAGWREPRRDPVQRPGQQHGRPARGRMPRPGFPGQIVLALGNVPAPAASTWRRRTAPRRAASTTAPSPAIARRMNAPSTPPCATPASPSSASPATCAA